MKLLTIVRQLNQTGAGMILGQADGQVYSYDTEAVETLYRLLNEAPARLRGAWIAAKTVGMGAAAIMVAGGVSRVHALVVSERAMAYLHEGGVNVTAETCVESILNHDGVVPSSLEIGLASLHDLPSILAAIEGFFRTGRR